MSFDLPLAMFVCYSFSIQNTKAPRKLARRLGVYCVSKILAEFDVTADFDAASYDMTVRPIGDDNQTGTASTTTVGT